METSEPLAAEENAGAPRLFAGGHHARLIDERVPYHIISRVFQGRHLLRPDTELNDLIIGVVGRAQILFPGVELFALAFLSNHFHAIARGPALELPFFIGYIKREISRRVGARPDIDWPGTMWHEYIATALPTAESQVQCLRYVLAQSVKEGLVERPQDWPGVHCVRALMLGRDMSGHWLDATALQREVHLQSRKARPKHVRRSDYLRLYSLTFSKLPAWSSLSSEQHKTRVADLVREICDEARAERRANGSSVLGAAGVKAVARDRRTALPKLPWFEKRKRMICWANPRDPDVRDYLRGYWDFQQAFKNAAQRFKAGALDADFPPRAFRPVSYRAPEPREEETPNHA